jgi:hypothetical protein
VKKVVPLRGNESNVLKAQRRLSDDGSTVELHDTSAFAMSQVSSIVAIGVVFEDLGCLVSVESLVLKGGDE